MIDMITHHSKAGPLVLAALCRSFSERQVHLSLSLQGNCAVVINPTDDLLDHISAPTKIVLLGKLSPGLAKKLGVKIFPLEPTYHSDSLCEPALPYSFRESQLKINYLRTLGNLELPLLKRAFKRYDFRDEWNNLGYGAVTWDHSIWSLSHMAEVSSSNTLAEITSDNRIISAYAALFEDSKKSILWFNRETGPIDSQEWRIIEYFFSSYRFNELPCLPVLSEIPFGYDGAVTMRLDCDEDITSARLLFSAYQAWDIPFSLAVHTALLQDKQHEKIIREVLEQKGAILSHSHTHPVNWGGNYDAAYQEAITSAAVINPLLIHPPVKYAVSPFHQTPDYALTALANAGYRGCIGGIIHCHPEFLLARGGKLAAPADLIGHSQSCMLHGECLLTEEDPLRIYKQAFDIALKGRALFGFLDHPFSSRYSYGFSNETTRIQAHQQWTEYMRMQGNILFLNENDAMDFLYYKSNIQIKITDNQKIMFELPHTESILKAAVEFKEEIFSLTEDMNT